jgi:hypothetical protein
VEEEIEELSAWCGPIVKHFGHQIGDFGTRYLHTGSKEKGALMVFSTHERLFGDNIPKFFWSLMDWYEIERERVKIISRPTLARKLIVAPQAEQLHHIGPSNEYLDLLDAHIKKKSLSLDAFKKVYVSRAGIKTGIAGERYIEHVMSAAGFHVFRPEGVPLEKQLKTYLSAELLLFSEGSALHGLQLLGRNVRHVRVLVRRRNRNLADASLLPRCESLEYLDALRGTITFRNKAGVMQRHKGISVLEEEKLFETMRKLGNDIKRYWNQEEYIAIRDEDISLRINRAYGRKDIEISQDDFLHQLLSLNLEHLHTPF